MTKRTNLFTFKEKLSIFGCIEKVQIDLFVRKQHLLYFNGLGLPKQP